MSRTPRGKAPQPEAPVIQEPDRTRPEHELPLPERFAAQHRKRPLQISEFKEELGISAAGVYRAMQHPSSELVSQTLGAALGFSARFVAMAHHRDALQRALEQRPAPDRSRAALLHRQVTQLNAELSYENPYSARGSCERLAFTALRMKYGVSQRDLARAHADRFGERGLEQFLLLRAYEENRPAPGFNKADWLETLRIHAPAGATITDAEHQRLANELQQAHAVMHTMVRSDVVDQVERGKFQIFGAPAGDPHRRMSWGKSCTAFGAIRIEVIDVRQPEDVARGSMRLVNAAHDSFQIGVVLKGRVRIDLDTNPFPIEMPGPPPPVINEGPLKDLGGVFEAGEVLAFRSQLWHRVEFLGADTSVLMILLERNVNLGRRLTPRKQPRATRAGDAIAPPAGPVQPAPALTRKRSRAGK